MYHFWEGIIKPIFDKASIKNIVEVGVDQGKHTELLMNYCVQVNGTLMAIDPMPRINEEEWKGKYGSNLRFYKDLSLNALFKIDLPYDAILLDGDHNWYTVYNELCIIEKCCGEKMPIILLHDVGWPYGRRDLYYNPEAIPNEFTHPHKKMGIYPNKSELVDGGLNHNLNNSIYENNLKNGVLTAIEDFINQSNNKYKLVQFDGFHGLGIIIEEKNKELVSFVESLKADNSVILKLENERILSKIARKELENIYRSKERRNLEEINELKLFIEQQATKINEKVQEINDLDALKEEKLAAENQYKLLLEINSSLENDRDNSYQEIDKLNQEKNQLKIELKKIQNYTKKMQQKVEQLKKENETYKSSIKYRLGDILINGLKPSMETFKMPFRVISLFKEGIKKKKASKTKNNYYQTEVLSKANESFASTEPMKIQSISTTQTIQQKMELDSFLNLPETIQLKKKLRNSLLFRDISYPLDSENKEIIGLMNQLKSRLVNEYISKPQNTVVSIIMPTFNREGTIINAVNSVLNQSYRNWELIIIDDGSTDQTEKLITQINDSRIVYLKNDRNSGVSICRNQGLKIAKGTYISYLDSDNVWDKDFLLLMLHACESTGFLTAYSAQNIYEVIQGKSSIVSIRFGFFNKSLLENRNYIDLNAFIHHKSMYLNYGGFDERMTRLVDWELINRYSDACMPFSLPCILGDYYKGIVTNQISNNHSFINNIQLFQKDVANNRLKLNGINNFEKDGKKPVLFSNRSYIKEKKLSNRVSIIIPNYEALNCLKLCVESIQKHTSREYYDLIIVDNASSESVVNYLKKLEADQIAKIILNEHNMGFTYAVNQGIELSSPETDIILMNNDAIVTEGWLHNLYNVAEDVEDVGIIAPRQVLLPYTKTSQVHVPYSSESFEIDVNLSAHHDNIVDPLFMPYKGYVEVSFVPFFAVLILRKVIKEVGNLDHENGRHYKSDRLYCQEATKKGFKLVYTPHSKLYHFLQQSTEELKKKPEMYKTIFVDNNWKDLNKAKAK